MAERAQELLIERTLRVASGRLAGSQLTLFTEFTEQLVHVRPDELMLEWPEDDVFGLIYGLYKFAAIKPDDRPLVNLINPDVENHGWMSPYTVVYLCQRDMPFLVDSVRMAVNRTGLDIHLFQSNPIWVTRDADGALLSVNTADEGRGVKEDFAMLLVDRQSDVDEINTIINELNNVLADVAMAVDDYPLMINRVGELVDELQTQSHGNGGTDQEEIAFLSWLRDGNFTLLGVAEFTREEHADGDIMHERLDQRFGLMRNRAPLPSAKLTDLAPGFASFYTTNARLAFTKSSRRSNVHRNVYSDYIVVKRRDNEGKTIGEVRLLGLYTSRLYHQSIDTIPLVREKARWLLEQSQLDPTSHNGKAFMAILQGHPRDELIQTPANELLDTVIGIWKIYERRSVRLFLRVDPFEKFASCIVYIPKDALRTEARERIDGMLLKALDAEASEYATHFLSESVLARMHFVFRITNRAYENFDTQRMEAEIRDVIHDWSAAFAEHAKDHWGEELGAKIYRSYRRAFPTAYSEQVSARMAVHDVALFKGLKDEQNIALSFFQEPGAQADIIRLKVFRRRVGLELSDIIPMLENLGFRVLYERPYEITPEGQDSVWMLDFTLRFHMDIRGVLDLSAVRQQFEEAFLAVWHGQAEDDGFNRLVLGARLDWRSVALLRAYARYLKQLGLSFSLRFVSDVLARHLDITRNVFALFRYRLDPRLHSLERTAQSVERAQRLEEKILTDLDTVENRNEDELLRHYLALIQATLRTSYFQPGDDYITLKLAPKSLQLAPHPRPEFEIYVYSPRMEGVHLRGGKVARGGLRWSDRLQDFRTEVLGLVKAQQVKNAVIVPTGAKGGFVCRKAHTLSGRAALVEEAVACYQLYISALLDVTDNREGANVVPPADVVRFDDDDPYLVVAGDKGTANLF